jgi:hypothetical protein
MGLMPGAFCVVFCISVARKSKFWHANRLVRACGFECSPKPKPADRLASPFACLAQPKYGIGFDVELIVTAMWPTSCPDNELGVLRMDL